MTNNKLGLIQGRLTPSRGRGIQFFPFDNWENEFAVAKDIGLGHIEWVFDFRSYEDNPLWTEKGCERIKYFIEQSGVSVHTVCFDYFMRRPFYKGNLQLLTENLNFYNRISQNLKSIGGSNVEIPMVDSASIGDTAEFDLAVKFLRSLAQDSPPNVNIVLESDLPSAKFLQLIENVGSKKVLVNYDVGDRVGCGFNPAQEILEFKNCLGNIHIKDKKMRGVTVPLEEGDVNFAAFFEALGIIGYKGNISLQVARGADGFEKEYVSRQMEFVRSLIELHLKGWHEFMLPSPDLEYTKVSLGGGKQRLLVSVGIMQGRLTPSEGRGIQFFPFETWQNEFGLAKSVGLNEIEWIFDWERYKENPLWSEKGCREIHSLVQSCGVRINSVCFDYFMRRPFFKGLGTYEENLKIFSHIVKNMGRVGAKLIEVPLVDDSSIKTKEERRDMVGLAMDMADCALSNNVNVSFETDLPPYEFKHFLGDISRNNVFANYDSGNSSGLGYDPNEEINVLGKLIANVHIKDRVYHGTTVKLGTGSADFSGIFGALKKVDYRGSFILQAARGVDGMEAETVREQLSFIRGCEESCLVA